MSTSPSVTPLHKDQVQWVVNDNAELGVKIGDQFFWLYKGESLVTSGRHGDGTSKKWRQVGKYEFGECCYPLKFSLNRLPLPALYTEELTYHEGLSDGVPEDGKWKEMPYVENP